MTTTTHDLKASICYAAEDLLRAESAESASIPMGDKVILIGPRSELARMLGYSTVRIPLIREGDKIAPAAAAAGLPAEPTEEMVRVAARELSDLNAAICNVDKDDQWKIYSEDFVYDARAALTKAFAAVRAALPADPVDESQPAAPDDWKPNEGAIPVSENTRVRVMLRDGYEGEDAAGRYRWAIYDKNSVFHFADIIKWRLAPAMEAQSHE